MRREAVAALDGHPELAPYAVLWRPGGPAAADSGRDPERFVGTLAAVVEVLGAVALADRVRPGAGAAGIGKMLDAAWRVDATATAEVLDAIGRAHPDKAVAKAARKALFEYRSARSQPPH